MRDSTARSFIPSEAPATRCVRQAEMACRFMRRMLTCDFYLWLVLFLGTGSGLARAQAVIEGRVELPKTHSAPVINKRYEIVTKGGVLSPSPPVAVVYLEGSFPQSNLMAV